MDVVFTTSQLTILADALETRYKADPSIFRLTEAPKHTFAAKLEAETVTVMFHGEAIWIMNFHDTYIVHRPRWFAFSKRSAFITAKSKLWAIAEDMLGIADKGDRFLYKLFPEMLEKNLTGDKL